MLHIIGLLLKWIGIILLAILGFLVLLVCIVLFVPVRYEIKASFPGDPKQITAQLRVSWLLHLISVRVAYQEEKADWKTRIAWKVFKEQDEEKKPKNTKPKSKKTKKSKKTAEPKPVKAAEEQTQPQISAAEQKAAEQPEISTTEQKPVEPDSPGKGSSEPEKPEHQPFRQRICDKIKAIFEKIKYTFRLICDKIKIVCETKEKVTEFLENEVHRTAFSKAVKEMVWLKRFLKPKKARADLHFGFDDPYKTGLTLAACGMIYPLVGEYISIRPDFEEQVLEGEFYMKGRLRAVYLVILAARLFFDKSIRTLYTDIRKIR